jgi:ArsR family transcriptional regulator
METYETHAKLFKVLMHPVRLAILEILRNGDECVCHMEAVLGLRQAYISQQLTVLREAELVQDRREGWNVFYRVSKPEIFEVIESAGRLVNGSGRSDERLYAVLRFGNCVCPKCRMGSQSPIS